MKTPDRADIAEQGNLVFGPAYPLDEDNYRGVKLLCQRFGIEMPADYAEFERT